MARATSGRRRRDAKLGQIPLSSGEIELYSRQDEAARRRQRLLAVREQERRLAQQVTQRYRQNLQKLQHDKSRRTREQMSGEQNAMLTELHRRYQNSLQSMGTAQRNARAKVLELMEQAVVERDKWVYNTKIIGKEREDEAQDERQEEEEARTARRRQVEKNMQRLKELSSQQRRQASARARQELDATMRRIKDKEELERLRRLQSPQEVFITPRPHIEDVESYRFTRTHCRATVALVKEKQVVTVIKHNRKHSTAKRGEDEAEKHREQVDQKRERDRRIGEQQEETAAERGKNALDDVTSRQQGQQALEWLALVDKMERRERGQELGGENHSLDGGDKDGVNDPQRVAERAFAQMLGLDEASMELSAFSIETDDESIGLASTDRGYSDNDETATSKAEYRVNIKGVKRNSMREKEFGRVGATYSGGRADVTHDKAEKSLEMSSLGEDETQELEISRKVRSMQKNDLPSKKAPVEPRGEATGKDYEVTSENVMKGPNENGIASEASPVQWKTYRNSKSNTEGQHRHIYDSFEERPEGTDSEDDELHASSHQDKELSERLEDRIQEILDFRVTRPLRDQPLTTHEAHRELMVSGSEADQCDDHINDVDAGFPRQSSDGATSAVSSFSATAGVRDISPELSPSASKLPAFEDLASGGHRPVSSEDEEPVSTQVFSDTGLLSYKGHISSEFSELRDDERFLKDNYSSLGPSEHESIDHQQSLADNDVHVDASPQLSNFEETDIAVADRLSCSTAASCTNYQSRRSDEDHGRDEGDLEALDTSFEKLIGVDDFGLPMLQREEVGEPARNNQFGGSEDRNTLELNAVRLSRSLARGTGTGPINSRNTSASGLSKAILDDNDDLMSGSASDSSEEKLHQKPSTQDDTNSRVVAVDEDSVSESSFAPSQKSISRLHKVAKDRAKSLGERFIDQHMLSFSSSEIHFDEGESESDLSRSSIGIGEAHPIVSVNPYDPYRVQIGHQTRRRSNSALSVAQYSLPPSDTKTSFDESLEQLHPGYGDDSFVNELVPIFPKRALAQPPETFDEDSQAPEEYNVQLVAPKMSRMLTSDKCTSFGRSRQRLAHQDHQEGGASNHSRRQSEVACEDGDASDRSQLDNEEFSSSSSAGSSNYERDVKSVKNLVDKSLPHRQSGINSTRGASTRSGPDSRQNRRAGTVGNAVDNLSEISDSDSGVSSFGFAVQLNFAAGTTRRRNNGNDRQEAPLRGKNQRNEADGAGEDNTSERSYASSSSLSMDAPFNYLASMTSAVGKSLPLYLRLPAVIYGKKDMTKPPPPIAWPSSSVSSNDTASEVDHSETIERSTGPKRISLSNSSMNESLQEVTPPRRKSAQRKVGWKKRGSESLESSSGDPHSKAFDESFNSDPENDEPLTFRNIKEKIAMLPPPPIGSVDMSQPPIPLQNLDQSSHSSSEQSYEGYQSSKRRQIPHPDRHPYEYEDERKSDDSSSISGVSSHDNNSASSSLPSSRRQSFKKAEKIVISVTKAHKNNESDGDRSTKEMTLADAFKRRHPGFGRRAKTHHDKLKRQPNPRQQGPERDISAKRTTKKSEAISPSSRGVAAVDSMPPEQQELLDRLATGSRAKISSREMKERSRRLYHQLPEIVERKRQEEVMRRRRERLNELREQEKERRLQQKQRRQQRR